MTKLFNLDLIEDINSYTGYSFKSLTEDAPGIPATPTNVAYYQIICGMRSEIASLKREIRTLKRRIARRDETIDKLRLEA